MKLAYKISIDKTDSKLFYSLFLKKLAIYKKKSALIWQITNCVWMQMSMNSECVSVFSWIQAVGEQTKEKMQRTRRRTATARTAPAPASNTSKLIKLKVNFIKLFILKWSKCKCSLRTQSSSVSSSLANFTTLLSIVVSPYFSPSLSLVWFWLVQRSSRKRVDW